MGKIFGNNDWVLFSPIFVLILLNILAKRVATGCMFINCKTWFSLRYGTFKTEELVVKAAELGISALAITNINSTADLWDFVDFCQQQNIKPVAGVEIRNDNTFLYILLAKNNTGLLAIHQFLSHHLQNKTDFPDRPHFGTDVFIIYPLGKYNAADLNENEWIGIQTTEINKLFHLKQELDLDKFVIRQPVTFEDKKYFSVHRLLRAIDRNIVLSKQHPNDIAGLHETFVTPEELEEAFKDYPSIIANTQLILDNCSVEMDFKADKTRKVFSNV